MTLTRLVMDCIGPVRLCHLYLSQCMVATAAQHCDLPHASNETLMNTWADPYFLALLGACKVCQRHTVGAADASHGLAKATES